MLYAKVDVPSASTVSRDVKEVYNIAKKNVGKVLQVCPDIFTLTMYWTVLIYSLTHREFISALMGGHLLTPSHFLVLLSTKSKMVNFSHISWTSLSMFPILLYTYCTDHGHIHHTRLSKGHTGWYLAEQLAKCIEEFGISEKVKLVQMSVYGSLITVS